jgi:hypothetical protein
MKIAKVLLISLCLVACSPQLSVNRELPNREVKESDIVIVTLTRIDTVTRYVPYSSEKLRLLWTAKGVTRITWDEIGSYYSAGMIMRCLVDK